MDLSERHASTGVRHPWEQARARFFLGLARELVDPTGPVRWIDVGAGDAWLAALLADELPSGSTMVCWDVNYTPDDLRSLAEDTAGVSFTVDQPDHRADVISLLDVIEHVADDLGLLESVVERNLADDGVVVVSVPAYQQLFTRHDTALAHHRRYSPARCREVLAAAGLRVEQEGGLFTTLLAPRALQAGLERVRRQADGQSPAGAAGVGDWRAGPLITRSLTTLLTADGSVSRWASRRGRLVPGLSYWAICRRSDR